MNEHHDAIIAPQHSKKIMPLLMDQIENDHMCSELRKFFANVKVTTLNKPDKQDPTAPGKDFRPIGSSEPMHKTSQNPMAREGDERLLRSEASGSRAIWAE